MPWLTLVSGDRATRYHPADRRADLRLLRLLPCSRPAENDTVVISSRVLDLIACSSRRIVCGALRPTTSTPPQAVHEPVPLVHRHAPSLQRSEAHRQLPRGDFGPQGSSPECGAGVRRFYECSEFRLGRSGPATSRALHEAFLQFSSERRARRRA